MPEGDCFDLPGPEGGMCAAQAAEGMARGETMGHKRGMRGRFSLRPWLRIEDEDEEGLLRRGGSELHRSDVAGRLE